MWDQDSIAWLGAGAQSSVRGVRGGSQHAKLARMRAEPAGAPQASGRTPGGMTEQGCSAHPQGQVARGMWHVARGRGRCSSSHLLASPRPARLTRLTRAALRRASGMGPVCADPCWAAAECGPWPGCPGRRHGAGTVSGVRVCSWRRGHVSPARTSSQHAPEPGQRRQTAAGEAARHTKHTSHTHRPIFPAKVGLPTRTPLQTGLRQSPQLWPRAPLPTPSLRELRAAPRRPGRRGICPLWRGPCARCPGAHRYVFPPAG